MVNGIHGFGGNAVRVTVRDGPGLVQVDQGRACSGKIRRNRPENDIIRPLPRGRRGTFRPRHSVVCIKFKEIT